MKLTTPNLLLIFLVGLLTCVADVNALAAIKVGDKLPAVNLHYGFPPTKLNTAPYLAGKNVLIVGLPGAFTPT